jgi:hypothetical protein
MTMFVDAGEKHEDVLQAMKKRACQRFLHLIA